MKTFLLSIIVSISSIFFYSAAIAQNTYPYPSIGNIGIGTTSPDTKLHIIGPDNNGTIAPLKITSVDNGQIRNMLIDGNEIDGDDGLYLNNNNNEEIVIAYGGGNVGVGTKSPDTKLHIIGAENNGTTATLKISSVINGQNQNMFIDGNEIDGDTDLRLNNNNNNNVVIAKGGGDVGIGTMNIPSGYRMAVKGKIITTEVKVKPYSMWPDYVFAPNYKLQPLKEVAAYIQAEKHLPGVPSAQEITKNGGFEVGQMTQTLLEKVEELTLYMIDLEEKNEALKVESEALKQRIETLEQ